MVVSMCKDVSPARIGLAAPILGMVGCWLDCVFQRCVVQAGPAGRLQQSVNTRVVLMLDQAVQHTYAYRTVPKESGQGLGGWAASHLNTTV